MTAHTHCPHCHAPAPKTPRLALRVSVLALAWTSSLFWVFAGILLGPGIIGVLPILIPMGIASITAAHGFAFADRECEACGKLIELDGRPLAAATAGPAREPAVEPAALAA